MQTRSLSLTVKTVPPRLVHVIKTVLKLFAFRLIGLNEQ